MMTFAFTAMDQIVNQMAKIHYMFGGQAPFPLVFRASTGGGRSAAAQHSQSPHPMFMNLAGLKLVMPSNPYDAKGLMKSAIRDNNPVVFFEDQILAALPDRYPVPEEEYVVPIGEADVKREGSDVTVVAISKMVPEALKAAEELEAEGISLEVVDPRTLVPMDTPAIRRSVQKDGPGRDRGRGVHHRQRGRRNQRPDHRGPGDLPSPEIAAGPRLRPRRPDPLRVPSWSSTACPTRTTSSLGSAGHCNDGNHSEFRQSPARGEKPVDGFPSTRMRTGLVPRRSRLAWLRQPRPMPPDCRQMWQIHNRE